MTFKHLIWLHSQLLTHKISLTNAIVFTKLLTLLNKTGVGFIVFSFYFFLYGFNKSLLTSGEMQFVLICRSWFASLLECPVFCISHLPGLGVDCPTKLQGLFITARTFWILSLENHWFHWEKGERQISECVVTPYPYGPCKILLYTWAQDILQWTPVKTLSMGPTRKERYNRTAW